MPFAPSCRQQDENCPQYTPCNAVWWKLHDTVGPAPYFRLQQQQQAAANNQDDFWDIAMIQDVLTDSSFFEQILFHHFDDMTPFLEVLGQSNSIQEAFATPSLWDANSSLS